MPKYLWRDSYGKSYKSEKIYIITYREHILEKFKKISWLLVSIILKLHQNRIGGWDAQHPVQNMTSLVTW